MKIKIHFQALPKSYPALCGILLPRPIRDAVDYANVAEVADAMVLWQDDFTSDQRDYFDLLCSLMEEYDSEHVKWPKLHGCDMIQHLMEEQNLTAADLSRILGGSRNLGAMILRKERNLTLNHVRKLAHYFKVSPELFI